MAYGSVALAKFAAGGMRQLGGPLHLAPLILDRRLLTDMGSAVLLLPEF